jgi:hypothetical protein
MEELPIKIDNITVEKVWLKLGIGLLTPSPHYLKLKSLKATLDKAAFRLEFKVLELRS